MEILEILGLREFRDRVAHALSDGEKKLVSIGTALAMRPEMLILDELTACLDESAVGRGVRVLGLRGLPCLVVALDRSFLDKVVDMKHMISDGRVTMAAA